MKIIQLNDKAGQVITYLSNNQCLVLGVLIVLGGIGIILLGISLIRLGVIFK